MGRSGAEFSFSEALLNSLNDPVFLLDSHHRIVVWNTAMESLTGVLADQVFNANFSDWVLINDTQLFSNIERSAKHITQATISGNEYLLTFEKITCAENECFKGTLQRLDHRMLTSLPSEYLVEIINASPISSIVFNLDGSILYSNNAYKEMWHLSAEDLNFVNHKYNLFRDKQLAEQGLLPIIKRAFTGKRQNSRVFSYKFNSSTLGRDESKEYRLMAHLYPILDASGKTLYVFLSFVDVTEYHDLQEAYRTSRERLERALKGANLGIWDWNLKTDKRTYNDRWASMLNYTLPEVYVIGWESLLHPDDKEKALVLMNKFASGAIEEYESEYRLRTKSGGYRWILDRGKILERDTNGTALRGSGTHIDITDRKLIEQQVAESELKYRKLVENAPIGIAILVEEKIMYINKWLAKMGEVQSPDQVIGASVRSFLVDDDQYQIFQERAALVLNHGEDAPLYATRFKTFKGNLVDVEVVSIPTVFDGKQAIQVLFHDITDRNQMLRELSRSQELLNQLFENSPMGIVLLDADFKVRNVNKGFESLFGYTNQQVRGKSLIQYIVPPELKQESLRLNEAAINGKIDYIESYRLDRDGNKKHLLIYTLPVLEENEHIGVYGIYVDIGQRLEAENELRTRNLELDNFVYKVSHDLRAPLSSILGLINLTKMEVNPVEKEYYISLMEGQVNKLDYFIRDILSHSKNLKMELSADNIDFKEVINKCFEDLGYLKAASLIKRTVTIDSGSFISDKWRINEIFRNLISNAIKYHNPNCEDKRIDISIKLNLVSCKILIADNGIGIAKDKIPYVLDMFYRGTENSDGSGIGLYIVQKAVEKLNGEIKIESEPMVGTKFQIILPTIKI